MASVSARYLFYQPMDEKIKTWTLHFPTKENLKMENALFDWPIVNCSMTICLMLLFCLGVFISRSYENRSKGDFL